MSQRIGRIRLMTAVGLIAFGWLAVLPWIAAQPQMKSHLDWLEAEEIDPSAMYYTELDAMKAIIYRQRTAEWKRTTR